MSSNPPVPRPAAPEPVRPADAEARTLAQGLLRAARWGALGVIDPESGGPMVTRVAAGWDEAGPVPAALILVSDLALHSQALRRDPACSLLVGEPGAKGDPLTHPRLTLIAKAEPADKAALRGAWLAVHPKAALYFDFGDFRLLRLVPRVAHLNGGFGRAWRLGPADLGGHG